MTTFYIGEGRPLADADFTRLAGLHGLDEAKLRAVAEVEARGRGSHSSGALVCLYEPHIAWRYTEGRTRDRLAAEGLARPKWKRDYPPTSFERIDRCAAIAGEEVAALATSWGVGQIMGFNHKACGFATARAMVVAFAESEANQLEGMIRFIMANPKMRAALAAGDWAGFASAYNGPGYRENEYDEKLADAYARWRDRLAARPPPGPEPAAPPPAPAEPVPAPPAAKPRPKPETPSKPRAGGWLAALMASLAGVITVVQPAWPWAVAASVLAIAAFLVWRALRRKPDPATED